MPTAQQTVPFWQDCQIFKERCQESPGIILVGLGDSEPTEARVKSLAELGWRVLAVSNTSIESAQMWLQHDVCIGAFMVHEQNVRLYRNRFPEKLVFHYDNVMLNTLRTMTQVSPTTLPIAGLPYTIPMPQELKTVDMVSCCAPVSLKRIEMTIETALCSGLSLYLFSQYFGANTDILKRVNRILNSYDAEIRPLYPPFEPYPYFIIGENIVIDSRPFGSNNGYVPVMLDRARTFLHTSTTEAFSNAVIEALMRNVPVVVCNDIDSPLQQIAVRTGNAITLAPPEPQKLAGAVRQIIMNPVQYGDVRESFSAEFDPFEMNRTVVMRCQELFEKKGIPWKGHCPGIMGENVSRMTLAESLPGQAQAAGNLPLYPNPLLVLSYLEFQIDIAKQAGNEVAKELLEREKNFVRDTLSLDIQSK